MKDSNRSYGAKVSHVTRRLLKGEPLTGKTLEFALNFLRPEDKTMGIHKDEFAQNIARKLEAGLPLDDYETHMMVDIWL